MNSPTTRYVVRSVLVGVATLASSLLTLLTSTADVTGRGITTAVLLGLLGALGYAGIGAGTSVEPKIGKQ